MEQEMIDPKELMDSDYGFGPCGFGVYIWSKHKEPRLLCFIPDELFVAKKRYNLYSKQ